MVPDEDLLRLYDASGALRLTPDEAATAQAEAAAVQVERERRARLEAERGGLVSAALNPLFGPVALRRFVTSGRSIAPCRALVEPILITVGRDTTLYLVAIAGPPCRLR